MTKRLGRGRAWIALVVALVAVTSSIEAASGYERPGETRIVSVGSDGRWAQSQNVQSSSNISGNGKVVAFRSSASDLTEVDRLKIAPHIFVRDIGRGITELITVDPAGLQAEGACVLENSNPPQVLSADSNNPVVNHTGRFVAYDSCLATLVPADVNNSRDVFLRDRKSARNELISVGLDGAPALGSSNSPSISADGRYVTFHSGALNLVPGDTNLSDDIFLRDRKTGTIKRLSIDSQGREMTNYMVGCGSLDPSGHFVAMSTDAALIEEDTNDVLDVYVLELSTGKLDRVSVASDGSQIPAPRTALTYQTCQGALSDGGRFVVYQSPAPNLVPNDSKVEDMDLFLFDRSTRRTRRISVNSYGQEKRYDEPTNAIATFGTEDPRISGNGRFIIFNTKAINFFPDDAEQWGGDPSSLIMTGYGDDDVFVHDVETGATTLASIDVNGKDAACKELNGDGGWSLYGSLSYTGERLAYLTCGRDMVPGDTRTDDEDWEIYIRDRGRSMSSGLRTSTGKSSQFCVEGSCLGPEEFIKAFDEPESSRRADIIEASLAYRPDLRDVFVSVDLAELSLTPVAPRVSSLGAPQVIGLRFESGGRSFEARASGFGAGTFGLYDCTPGQGSACTKVADLLGGFGTTGERVVFSVPLDAIDATDGGSLRDVEAFVGIGAEGTGALSLLDTLAVE